MWGAEGSKPPIWSTTLPPNFMQNHRHRRCVPVDTQDFKAAFRWITVSSYHLDLNGPLAAQWVQRHFASHWQCDLLNHIVVVTAGRVPRSCFWTVNGSHDFSCIFCKIISVGKGRPVCNTSILTPQLTGCSEFLLISDFDLASLGWLDQWKLAIRRKNYGSSHCNVGFQAIPNGNSGPFATLMQCGNRKRAYGENWTAVFNHELGSVRDLQPSFEIGWLPGHC